MEELQKIEQRKAEIKAILEDETQEIDVTALDEELRSLKEKEQAIKDDMADEAEERKLQEQREIAKNLGNKGKEIDMEERKVEFNKENVLKSSEYRSAWARTLMGQPLNEVEQRAVGVALTTTATSYVGAGVGADGVNNGGLFIPEDVMMELMSRIELVSPFFRDIPKTAVNGYVKFPYRVSGTGAIEAVEGTANTDGQVQWAELVLTVLEVSETIRVTWKLEAMSVDGFINYILDELSMAIPEKIATDIFYGDGTGTVTGIAASGAAIDGEYTIGSAEGNVADIYGAMTKAITLQTDKRKKMGAKFYVAQDVMEAMAFARDVDDKFLFNPINGVGIQSFGKYPIEVDPFLSDGDFVFGNPQYYRFNWNESLSITKDVSGKNRINDYTGYAVVSGAPQPASFVYGKKSV